METVGRGGSCLSHLAGRIDEANLCDRGMTQIWTILGTFVPLCGKRGRSWDRLWRALSKPVLNGAISVFARSGVNSKRFHMTTAYQPCGRRFTHPPKEKRTKRYSPDLGNTRCNKRRVEENGGANLKLKHREYLQERSAEHRGQAEARRNAMRQPKAQDQARPLSPDLVEAIAFLRSPEGGWRITPTGCGDFFFGGTRRPAVCHELDRPARRRNFPRASHVRQGPLP